MNNYERLRPLAAKSDVRFVLDLSGGRIEFPSSPATIPADSACIWPFGLEVAPGVRLDHATAQLLCSLDEGNTRTVFFAATPGVPAEFAFNGSAPALLTPGRDVALSVQGSGETTLRIVLLDAADSLALWKDTWRGRERVFLTRAGLVVDGDALRLGAEIAADLALAVFPPLDPTAPLDGVFQPLRFTPPPTRPSPPLLEPVCLRAAGPAREIPLGWTTPPVAVAPVDADFAAAAAWRIVLPAGLDVAATPLLRLRYTGDVARVRVGDRLVLDDFFNGDVLELDLVRHAAALDAGAALTVEILPLRADAPILLPAGARPAVGSPPVACLAAGELVPRHHGFFS